MTADVLPPDPPVPASDVPSDALAADLLLALTHDLRSPLATVIHAAELLAGGRLAPDGPEWRRALALLTESAGDLQRTNEDLLLLERVVRAEEHVALPIDEIDVAEVARSAQAATRARDREVDLDGASVSARVNRTLLRHLFEALLDNAALHTGPADRIGVEARRQGDRLLLVVWDSGPGVAASDRETVFLPFRRGSVTAGDGVGVGLHLVARFAAALGGRAWVEDGPEGGARFCVDLAIAP
ncbi:MAG: HAMP domain-containing histidine kinase [Acidimicrobiales bacterium]|nr:HAMP domain-containing histidine kinase [Acidimicrobiales bacterium]